jgi:serine/threonine protein kinase
LRAKLSQLEIPLTNSQVDEMIKVTQIVFSRVFRDPVVNIRKRFQLDETTRTTMGYLVRRGRDVVVYPHVIAASGVDKEVKVAVAISEDGNVKLLEEVRIKKNIRHERPDNRLLSEFYKRAEFSPEFICAPGEFYQYVGKTGSVKISWLMPHYNTCGERFARTLNIPQLRVKRFPYTQENCIQLILGAAKALNHLHNKGQIHRDVKLANILFNISPTTKQIESVVLTDLVYTKSLGEIKINYDLVVSCVKTKHNYSALKATNPIFWMLIQESNKDRWALTEELIPSTENYKTVDSYAQKKDKDSTAIIAFLEELDNSLKVGTPGHIPPEFWHTRSYSKAGDIYALGVSLNMLLAILRSAGVDFSDVSVKHMLEGLVQGMCHKDPTIRPTADRVIARLELLLH